MGHLLDIVLGLIAPEHFAHKKPNLSHRWCKEIDLLIFLRFSFPSRMFVLMHALKKLKKKNRL